MKNDNSEISFFKEAIILLVLALILLNLFDSAIYWCYLLIPVFIFILSSNSSLIDKNFTSLLVFSILYPLLLLLYQIKVANSILLGYFLFPPIFYFLGKYLVHRHSNKLTIYFLLFFTTILFSILPFSANIISIIENGFMTQRNISLFWEDKGTLTHATNIGSYFAFNLALLPAMFSQNNSFKVRKYKILALILLIISLIATFNMSNRTGILIMTFSLLVSIMTTENRRKYIILIFLLLIIVTILYINDILSIRTWFRYTHYFDRITATNFTEESRLLIWKRALSGFSLYPFGNIDYNIGASYAHNLWLDTARKSGIITLIPLLYITFLNIYYYLKVILNKSHDEFLRLLISGFGVAFYITFFVEPILDGLYIMFFLYCFYFGILVGINRYL